MLTSESIDVHARQLGAKRLRLELPWEQQPLKDIFGRSSVDGLSLQPPQWVDVPQSFEASASKTGVVDEKHFGFKHARMRLSQISWLGAENRKLQFALQCWKVIVLGSTTHTALGRTLLDCSEQEKSEDEISEILNDVFAMKSTSTLRTRAASLLAFGRWKRCISGKTDCGIFPITEELAYRYLCDLRRNNAAASKRKRFLEAVGFAKGLLGADVDEVLESARVSGVAHGGFVALTRKKNPFSTEQIITLENMATYGSGPSAIFAGYICFLVHCRLRWSDGQHCVNEPHLDITDGQGFVEASLYHHKTARKRRTQQMIRLLPVAGVLPGLSGQMWAVHWILKRRNCNLQASMTEPTMPSPIITGGWNKLPLSSSEASVWLREILNPWYAADLSDLATHSAKATILSWMAKANVSVSVRRLAGYHIKPGDKSALEYSRDAAAPILREIEAIFISIRAGLFKPDEQRSRRWVGCTSIHEAVKIVASGAKGSDVPLGMSVDEATATLDGKDVLEKIHCDSEIGGEETLGIPSELISDDTCIDQLRPQSSLVISNAGEMDDSSECMDSLSSSSSLESDSVSTDRDRKAEIDGEINALGLVPPSDLCDKVCYRHNKSRKLHIVKSDRDDAVVFYCGRKAGWNYTKLDSTPAFDGNGCIICFNYSSGPVGDSESS